MGFGSPDNSAMRPVRSGAAAHADGSMRNAVDRSRVAVVVPAFNEGEVIEDVLSDLVARYPNTIVVDDGSCDNTYEVARREAPVVLRHRLNRGQGAALQTGIEYALRQGSQIIVTFDSDGQHRPEDVDRLIAPIQNGEADIALGSRFLGSTEGMPRTRRAVLGLGILFTRLVSGMALTDTHNGLRAFSHRAARGIDIRLDRMAHASELLDLVRRSRYPFVEVAVEILYTDRSIAKSTSSARAFRIAYDYLTARVTKR